MEKLTKEQKAAQGIVEIHGKDYHTVAKRILDFREKHPEWGIKTKVRSAADLVHVEAKIYDEGGRLRATGNAEENRSATSINKTSALENCETSAVGRALALLGFAGIEIASAEELAQALEQQRELQEVEDFLHHNSIVRDHIESITAIKAYLLNDEYSNAYEAMHELMQIANVWETLWRSTKRGGIWTPKERGQMKSDEMTAAKNDYHGETL